MQLSDNPNEVDFSALIQTLKAADLPDVDKLARAFAWITGQYIEHYQREVELLRAIQDRETLVKEQIKLEMMKHTRQIFRACYRLLLAKEAWDEPTGD